MPFKETCPVEERVAMFFDYDTGVFTVRDLCRRHGVTPDTFYRFKKRRDSGEVRWFEDRSRRPLACPHAVSAEQADAIVALRRRFSTFGPKKLKAWLERTEPGLSWPAASTIGDILDRARLVAPRRSRRRAIPQGEVIDSATMPNAEWPIDFKGWFRTRDGSRCDPLTVTDSASRYLLAAVIVPPTHAGVKSALERLFAEVGLPDAIRSDNGAPFGSTGAGGLSRLSVWLLKLGIEPRHIPPASPQDNGRHERMHRTLKAETTRPPEPTIAEQQTRFDGFRRFYNEERPHEALAQTPPSSHWRPPERRLPKVIERPWYDANHEVRNVRPQGQIKWRGEQVFIGEAFVGEPVGLKEREDGRHLVRFCHRDLAVIDREFRFHRFAPPRARMRVAAEAEFGTKEE